MRITNLWRLTRPALPLFTLAASILLGLPAGAFAQSEWTTNGNNINNTNTGNVGVGATAPAEGLHVKGNVRVGSAPSTLTRVASAASPSDTAITVLDTSGYPASGTLVIDLEAMTYTGKTATTFTNVTRGAFGTAATAHESNAVVDNYIFTAVAQDSTTTPRFVVTGGGSVGIGHPVHLGSEKLIIRNPAGALASLIRLEQLQGANDRGGYMSFIGGPTGHEFRGFIGFGKSGSSGATLFPNELTNSLSMRSEGPLHLGTGGANIRMTIGTTGNVGVGTTAPNYKLDLVTASSGTQLRFGSDATDSGGYLISTGPSQAIMSGGAVWNGAGWVAKSTHASSVAAYDGALHFFTNTGLTGGGGFLPSERMIITAFGAVGVGTVAPAHRLDVQGGAINASGGLCIAGDCKTAWSQVSGTPSQWTTSGSDIYFNTGNVGIGTAPSSQYKVDINGNTNVTGNLNVTGNINAKYQDVAEWVPSTQKLAAGTVVILDPARSNHVLASATAYDTAVAGVVSEQPGLILGEGGEGKLMVATTGRVKVRVDATRGPVRIGDLLVTSGVPGAAMKSVPIVVGDRQMHAPGTIIGKALEPLEKGVGEILVLLSLQ